jgi:hypothetical protein
MNSTGIRAWINPGGAWQGIDRFRDIPFALHYEFVPPR